MAQSPWQPHKGQPLPLLQREESDRPIRAGRRDTHSAVITAPRGEEPGRGHHTPARPPKRSVSDLTRRAGGPLEVVSAARGRHPHLSITCGTCHQEQLAAIPRGRAARPTPPGGLWEHTRHRQGVCPALFGVGDLRHLSPDRRRAIISSLRPPGCHGDACGGRREGDTLILATMTSIVTRNLPAFLSDAFKV